VLKVTIKTLVAHRRRMFATFLAVVLAVGFLVGNFVLTDTIKRTFGDLFTDVNRGTDALVRSDNEVETPFGGTDRARLPESLVETIRAQNGVRAAEPQVLGYGQLIAKDGDALGDPAMGAPTYAGSWSTVEGLNPFTLADGRGPETAGEVVIDRKSAKDGDLDVGDHTKLITVSGPVEVSIVGVATFGDADSPAGRRSP
jgi:putative ABC transport system permease protein